MRARALRCRAASCDAKRISTHASCWAQTRSSMSVVTARTAPAERTLADRLIAAVPLLSIFLWLCIVYAVEAWAHATPWLFGGEPEFTQLARSLADTGEPA